MVNTPTSRSVERLSDSDGGEGAGYGWGYWAEHRHGLLALFELV